MKSQTITSSIGFMFNLKGDRMTGFHKELLATTWDIAKMHDKAKRSRY